MGKQRVSEEALYREGATIELHIFSKPSHIIHCILPFFGQCKTIICCYRRSHSEWIIQLLILDGNLELFI